jgi:hypothetical protein
MTRTSEAFMVRSAHSGRAIKLHGWLACALEDSVKVFLLLLCNDKLFPGISEWDIVITLVGGSVFAIGVAVGVRLALPLRVPTRMTLTSIPPGIRVERGSGRTPTLDGLPPARLTLINRIWLVVLRAYLLVARGLVLIRIAALVAGQG